MENYKKVFAVYLDVPSELCQGVTCALNFTACSASAESTEDRKWEDFGVSVPKLKFVWAGSNNLRNRNWCPNVLSAKVFYFGSGPTFDRFIRAWQRVPFASAHGPMGSPV